MKDNMINIKINRSSIINVLFTDFPNYNYEFISKFKKLLETNNNDKIYLKDFEIYYNLNHLNIIKILYFNRNKIHEILYDKDIQIIIDCKLNNLSFNFYLSLLIRENPDCIDYCFSFDYIKEIYDHQKLNTDKKYNKIFISKVILELIDYYKNIDEGIEESELDNIEIENIEKECNKIIKDNLNIFKELNINWSIDEIKQKKIDEIYSEIIKKLIIEIKNKDFEYILNIINQLDLKNIDIIRKIFNEKSELINLDKNIIGEYLILKDEDLFNEVKINFYYIILEYILNGNSLFIYNIEFLLKTKKLFLNLINSNSNIFSSSKMVNMDCNIKKRFESILSKITDSKYYIFKYNKLKSNISRGDEILKKYNDEKVGGEDIKNSINKNNNKLNNIENSSNNESTNSMNNATKNIVYDSINNNQETTKGLISESVSESVSISVNESVSATYSKVSNISSIPYKKEININSTQKNKKNSIESLDRGPISGSESSYITNDQNNKNKLKSNELSEYKIFKFKNIIGNHNNNSEEKRTIKNNSKIYTADFIEEISKGFISAGTNNEIIIYNKSFEKLYTKYFENPINNICELKTLKNYGIIICLKNNIYFFDLNNNSLKEMNYENENLKKSNLSFLLKINESNYLVCYEHEAFYYSDLFSDIVTTSKNTINDIRSVKSAIKINNYYSALKLCNIYSKGYNAIMFYKNKINKIKIVRNNDFSFTYTVNGLTVLPREENNLNNNNKILLCACKKYIKNQKNGILLVNLEFKENEINDFNIDRHFYNTGNFEVYCFCPLFIINNNKILNNNDIKIIDTEYFLVGGFNIDKKIGEIKLYKVFYGKNFSENSIEYIEDIIIDKKDNLKSFRGPISSIIQDKTNELGNILITCWDGYVYLFSSLNIKYYLKYDEKVKNNILFEELFGKKK